MATSAELRSMADDQLLDQLDGAKQELFNLRFQLATGQLENSARIKEAKKAVARCATVIRDREIAAAEALLDAETEDA